MAGAADSCKCPYVRSVRLTSDPESGCCEQVYKVQRNSDDPYYALKETDLGTLTQLQRMDAVNEVRLLVSMNHTNVVSRKSPALGAGLQ